MPYMIMDHEIDPAQKLKNEIGDISGIEIFNNQVLCAVYIRPDKTKGGIMLANQTTEEDRFQSKVGLVVKMGPQAFVDETNSWFADNDAKVGDWIVFRPSDSWSITVNGVLCRILEDMSVRGRVTAPDLVW
jgi:co-chaperonin GroES (HSP10)